MIYDIGSIFSLNLKKWQSRPWLWLVVYISFNLSLVVSFTCLTYLISALLKSIFLVFISNKYCDARISSPYDYLLLGPPTKSLFLFSTDCGTVQVVGRGQAFLFIHHCSMLYVYHSLSHTRVPSTRSNLRQLVGRAANNIWEDTREQNGTDVAFVACCTNPIYHGDSSLGFCCPLLTLETEILLLFEWHSENIYRGSIKYRSISHFTKHI